jgi:hypothetical protein
MKLPNLSRGIDRLEFARAFDAKPTGVTAQRFQPDVTNNPINYGKWCGPNHGGDRLNDPPPVDAVDAVCMRHDLCYISRGMHECSCNSDFQTEMAAALATPGLSNHAREYGVAAIGVFGALPCVCRRNACVNVPTCNIHGCHVRQVCHTIAIPGAGGHCP